MCDGIEEGGSFELDMPGGLTCDRLLRMADSRLSRRSRICLATAEGSSWLLLLLLVLLLALGSCRSRLALIALGRKLLLGWDWEVDDGRCRVLLGLLLRIPGLGPLGPALDLEGLRVPLYLMLDCALRCS